MKENILKTPLTSLLNNGINYLLQQEEQGFFPSWIGATRTGANAMRAPREMFSAIVIGHALSEVPQAKHLLASILRYVNERRLTSSFAFFEDDALLPPDADAYALGHALLFQHQVIGSAEANAALDKIMNYRTPEGKVQVWLSETRENRLDHVVAANVLLLAGMLNRTAELQPTLHWVKEELTSGRFLAGSRYYHGPESFLLFLQQLTQDKLLERDLKPLLADAVRLLPPPQHTLQLAAHALLGGTSSEASSQLLHLQQADGSWPVDALYREGKKERYYCNASVPTAFALKSFWDL